MKKVLVFIMVMAIFSVSAWAAGYQYIGAADLKQKVENQEQVLLLDIQVEGEFSRHHVSGAIPTYAYPVKSEADRDKLKAVLAQIKTSEEPVVIVCPRGAGGAERTYDYLKSQGVAEKRMRILEGGQQEWPYEAMLAK